eukprot:4459657-Pyramimonas_sp.AAC.1
MSPRPSGEATAARDELSIELRPRAPKASKALSASARPCRHVRKGRQTRPRPRPSTCTPSSRPRRTRRPPSWRTTMRG